MTSTSSSASAAGSSRAGHLVRLVENRLGMHVVESAMPHKDGDRFTVKRARLLELCAFLHKDPDADLALLVDVTGVDRGADKTGDADPRFSLHVHLRSARLGYRALILTHATHEDPTMPSLTSVYPAAEALERELYEMLGVYPDGHPQIRPLLLYPGFAGHPLRKDYRAGKEQPLVPVLDDEARPIVIASPSDDEAAP